jgi:hypothetical protein
MDIMLDIETLATSPDSVILTFGAIKFDPFDSSKEMNDGIYFRIDIDEQSTLGRHGDDNTRAGGGNQAEDVREEALGEGNRISLEEFSKQLNRFIVGCDNIWAQGPVFDIVILENLYRQMGLPCPWQFWQIRDSRTLLSSLGDPREKNKAGLHNALEDAVSQAQAVQYVFKQAGITEKR